MDLLQHLRAQARANRLANRRLHEAMSRLTRDDFHAPRTSFFPSLATTLNHILAVDIYYIDALHGVETMAANYDAFIAADTIAALGAAAGGERRTTDRVLRCTDQRPMPRSRSTATITSTATSLRACCSTCSCTRRTIAARRTRCCRARR